MKAAPIELRTGQNRRLFCPIPPRASYQSDVLPPPLDELSLLLLQSDVLPPPLDELSLLLLLQSDVLPPASYELLELLLLESHELPLLLLESQELELLELLKGESDEEFESDSEKCRPAI